MSGVSAHDERYISKFADGTSVSETYVRAIRHQTVLREPTATVVRSNNASCIVYPQLNYEQNLLLLGKKQIKK